MSTLDVYAINTDGIEYRSKRHLFKLPEKTIHPSHFRLVGNNRQTIFLVQLNAKQFVVYDYLKKQKHPQVFDLESLYQGKEWNSEQKMAYKNFFGSLNLEEKAWKAKAPVFKSKELVRKLEDKEKSQLSPSGKGLKEPELNREYELQNKIEKDRTWYSFSDNKLQLEKLYNVHDFQTQIHKMSKDWIFKDIKLTKSLIFCLIECPGETHQRSKFKPYEEVGGCLDGSKYIREEEGVVALHTVFYRVVVFDLQYRLIDEIDVDITELLNGTPCVPFTHHTVVPNPYDGYHTRISDWLKIEAFDSPDGKHAHVMIITKSIPDQNMETRSVNDLVSRFEITEMDLDQMLVEKGVKPVFGGSDQKRPSKAQTLNREKEMKTTTVYDLTRPTINLNIYSYATSSPHTKKDNYGNLAQIFINSPVEHKHIQKFEYLFSTLKPKDCAFFVAYGTHQITIYRANMRDWRFERVDEIKIGCTLDGFESFTGLARGGRKNGSRVVGVGWNKHQICEVVLGELGQLSNWEFEEIL